MEDQHQQAIETLAAERYMLDQMTEAERETFEEHYFNCRICVENVKAIDLMSRAIQPQPIRQPVRKWRPMTVAPWAIAAGLAGALTLQPILMHMAPVAQVAEVPYAAPAPLTTESRGVAAVTKLPAGRNIILYLEITHDPQYTQYRWDLRADKAKSLASGTVAPEKTNAPIPLLLRPLPAGSYELVIEGVRKDGNRSPIIIHPLVVGGS